MSRNGVLWFAFFSFFAATGATHTYYGPAVSIGSGSARTFVTEDSHHRPATFGMQFSASMLNGLPAKPGSDRSLDWAYYLYFPKSAPAVGFDHVMINWHPLGHAPQGIYTVPHFDLHFYLISRRAQLAIRYPHPETPNMAGVVMPAKGALAPGYMIAPGTQVNEMGLHAIPGSAPELHGKPFTNTMIYGYGTDGSLIFVEPMITMSYLLAHPNEARAIPQPAGYSYPAYYPGSYAVTYDAAKRTYVITFTRLTAWQAEKLAAKP